MLNKRFPYDDELARLEAVGSSSSPGSRWRAWGSMSVAAFSLLLVLRLTLFAGPPGGLEWLQATGLAVVATMCIAQGTYLLGVLADPDKK
ncbi:hypothetical protein IWX75_000048 [Arthrobacter sp. CAN_A6]|uniref:hypothetical protein n=1 Tax=Arthrobacter sp. CAN_A6 TaxID=2787721 RepID=UPI0018CBC354